MTSTEEKGTPMTSAACPGAEAPDTEVSTDSKSNISELLAQVSKYARLINEKKTEVEVSEMILLGNFTRIFLWHGEKYVDICNVNVGDSDAVLEQRLKFSLSILALVEAIL